MSAEPTALNGRRCQAVALVVLTHGAGCLGAVLGRAADGCSWFIVWQRRDMLSRKNESVRVFVGCGVCKGTGISLTIASGSARMVRGCGEGAAHDSGRHDAAIRGAWGWAVRSGRRASMTVESWPLVAVLLVVRIVSESRASCCPSWWQPAGCDADEKPPARRQDHKQGGRCPC